MAEFTVLATAEEVAEAAAAEIAELLSGGAQTLVLTGGTSPKRCYELLSELDLEWGRVSILFGDERCVPPLDPESNYRMAKESLLDRVHPATDYRIPAELGPDESADLYAEVVADTAPLDIVLLGVGEDGQDVAEPQEVRVRQGRRVREERGRLQPGDALGPGARRHHAAIRDDRREVRTPAQREQRHAWARRGETPSGMITGARWLIDRAAAGRG